MQCIKAVRAPVKALLFSLMVVVGVPVGAAEFNLPSLGDTSSSIMSREQEYQLGRAWLSMLRGSVRTLEDPLLRPMGGKPRAPDEAPMLVGHSPTRKDLKNTDEFLAAMAELSARGEPVRRNEILAMIHVAFPEMKAAFGEMPDKVVIVSAGDPMWRGGLSGPQSLYMHADRPLISENGTSTLVHELVHLITRIQGTHEHWIAEGTAEYYSLALLRRSGLISESRFQRGLDWMANHGRNVRTLRGVRSHGPVTARAVTLFAALDAEIQESTGGERDLDDVMRLLMAIRHPTLEDLEAAVEEVMGAPAQALDTPLLRP